MSVVENKVKDLLKKSGNVFVYCGTAIPRSIGLNGVIAEHIAYDIEDYYGYSSEEIMTESFLTRRVKLFFDYYQNIMLGKTDPGIPKAAYLIKELQEYINIETISTNNVYGLYEKAGCENVIAVNGCVEKNTCPSCGKTFDANYVRANRIIPLCDKCKVPLRPGFTLIGETIDNGLITKAINAVEKADTFLVIGSSLRNKIFKNLIKYYEGNNLILINTEELFGDDIANYRIYGDITDCLERITEDIKKELPKREKKKVVEEADEEEADTKKEDTTGKADAKEADAKEADAK
ncbi:MAG: hypothetical protein K6G11_06410 [Lachnospiraceae bacterium]|nr:hypothetical protein [Lachnospiraceae bacterium]